MRSTLSLMAAMTTHTMSCHDVPVKGGYQLQLQIVNVTTLVCLLLG